MPTWSGWSGGHLVDLRAEECWELLASRPVGRIAWQSADGPMVVPVNYAVQEHAVWLRTSPYSALVRECDDSRVAFEADDVDDFHRTGWSVLVRGTARVVFAHDHVPHHVPDTDVWPAGARPLDVRIDIAEITGRRLLPS